MQLEQTDAAKGVFTEGIAMTHVHQRIVCFSGALAALLCLAPQARSDCALGADYEVTVMGNTVVVCANGIGAVDCGASSTMLRQDTASGALVQLATFCTLGDGGTDAGSIQAGCMRVRLRRGRSSDSA